MEILSQKMKIVDCTIIILYIFEYIYLLIDFFTCICEIIQLYFSLMSIFICFHKII